MPKKFPPSVLGNRRRVIRQLHKGETVMVWHTRASLCPSSVRHRALKERTTWADGCIRKSQERAVFEHRLHGFPAHEALGHESLDGVPHAVKIDLFVL